MRNSSIFSKLTASDLPLAPPASGLRTTPHQSHLVFLIKTSSLFIQTERFRERSINAKQELQGKKKEGYSLNGGMSEWRGTWIFIRTNEQRQ